MKTMSKELDRPMNSFRYNFTVDFQSKLLQLSGTATDPEFYPSFPCTIIDNDESSIQAALMAADYIVYSIAEGGGVAEAQQVDSFRDFLKL